MKVLFSNEAPLIKYGLAAGFEQTGHQVQIMQGEAGRLWGIPAEEQQVRLSRAMENFQPDLLFTEGHPGIEPEVLYDMAKRYGIPHLYWAIEDPVSTDFTLATYAPRADLIFTTAVECLPVYQKIGKKAELLLFGCNPAFHRFTDVDPEYSHDLVLVASNYSSRYEEAKWFIKPLVTSGYDIKIWGGWWDDPGRPVNLIDHPQVYGGLLPYELLPTVYSSAKIILGMNCDDSSKTQTSMRPYEAMACGGGLYLAHYTKAQEYLFKDYLFQTRNTHETLATVNRILAMPEVERRKLATRAQIMVTNRHSYATRARQIVEAMRKL